MMETTEGDNTMADWNKGHNVKECIKEMFSRVKVIGTGVEFRKASRVASGEEEDAGESLWVPKVSPAQVKWYRTVEILQ
jgi:hypothetical protein